MIIHTYYLQIFPVFYIQSITRKRNKHLHRKADFFLWRMMEPLLVILDFLIEIIRIFWCIIIKKDLK
ncbi:hypothetical protein DRJ83_03940 [Enterococcus faecalis]|nr:hypothetical protein DRJ83_03940 [Enterococcus faecalis]